MNTDAIVQGQADLEKYLVTPCALSLGQRGWYYYKYRALPGHPQPGNADQRRVFSLPHPLTQTPRRLGKSDTGGLGDDYRATDAEVVARCKPLIAALGWTDDQDVQIDIARESAGTIYSVDISRWGVTTWQEYPSDMQTAGSPSEHDRIRALRNAEAAQLRSA